MQISSKVVIGIVEYVSLRGVGDNIPAKIDTGADSSSIWATNVNVGETGVLQFTLFGPGSDWYTGEIIEVTDFTVASVKNSTGQSEIRYRTRISLSLGGKRIRALFNLSDRSNSTYKILIGRRTISGKFLVDVEKRAHELPKPNQSRWLRKALASNPYEFHKKHTNGRNGDRI